MRKLKIIQILPALNTGGVERGVLDFNKYLDSTEINSFEKEIIKEFYNKLKENILFLSSNNNWLIIYDKKNFPIKNINLLEDFNKS